MAASGRGDVSVGREPRDADDSERLLMEYSSLDVLFVDIHSTASPSLLLKA
jgi:hypothetical protein